ncbi:MAG: NAD(P)H-hydrate dehydratase, partial [Candidatus Latescibacteria bacterium]|nr:NAD(P)H-hydrate dehydratase [Candidatus Latescibacterota bacterium]
IRADQTVTMGLMKIDLAIYPGKAWGGKTEVADIGFPADAIKAENLWMSMPDREEMARLIPTHHPAEHKGDRGRVAVVAGSVGMAGAAVLTSKAAMRAGAGMTILGAPVSLVDVMAMKMTEVMIRPLPETTARTTGLKALSNIEDMTSWADVLAIGPGLSQHQETTELIRQVVHRSPLPVVLDADGINAFIDHTELFSACASDIVMTPHIGELSRLTNRTAQEIMNDRIGIAKQTAQSLDVTVILKGACSVIADPTGRVSINPTGNPGMATAGSGDVLTGILSALISQGLPVWDAARLGVYLHGLAGDLGAKAMGQHSLIAGDLIDHLPGAFLQVRQTCRQRD